MMLQVLFEETTYAEKKKMREAQTSGTTGTGGGEGAWETPAWLGNDHEVYAFEDEEFWEA